MQHDAHMQDYYRHNRGRHWHHVVGAGWTGYGFQRTFVDGVEQ